MGLRSTRRYETLVSSHTGALEHESSHAFFTQAEGQVAVSNFRSLFPLFFCGLPASAKETTPLSICRPVLPASEL